MHRVGRGRDEIEMLVEGARLFVLGVNSEGADARNVGCLQCPKKSILQQGLPDASTLAVPTYGEAGQEHDRDGTACEAFLQTLGCCGKRDFADDQRVIADDTISRDQEIGLRGVCLLVLQRIADQKSVKRFLATIEAFQSMITLELLDLEVEIHLRRLSITLGSFSNLAKWGRGLGGASSAA